jgi:CPA2 family monovalent cation:H+ antiporter-2
VVAGALISIALNPLVFRAGGAAAALAAGALGLARRLAARDDPLAELPMTTEKSTCRARWCWWATAASAASPRRCGAGRLPFVVAEQNRELVEQLRARGVPAVFGDAASPRC